MFAIACFIHSAHGKSALKVESSGDAKSVRFQVFPSKPAEAGILELLDDQTGDCLQTVHAGFFSSGQVFSLAKNHRVKPGRLRVRYRQGIQLAVDQELSPPRGVDWVNPCDLVWTGKALYVLDSGRTKVRRGKDDSEPARIVAAGKTCVWKFLPDGKPDPGFADGGRLVIRDKPSAIRSLTVDEQGVLYVPLGGHYIKVQEHQEGWSDQTVVGGFNAVDGWVTVPSGGGYVETWDSSGNRLPRTVGGYDRSGDADFWSAKGRNTQHINSVALGPDHRIYLHVGEYAVIRVYDRTISGLDGCLYTSTENASLGGSLPRCIASNRMGAVYLATANRQIIKLGDDGKEIKIAYASEAEPRMILPTGLSVSGDLLWVAANGADVPYWDSGGGEAVFLYWDNGGELLPVESYGKAGTKREGIEFMNPSATAQSSDHLTLWVAEDGMSNADGPPGNARVRRFKITSTESEEVAFTLK